ncbi:MAG: adenine phosphoribosyltransferase [Salibacteraceae bacterium]|nr:adenine phosphoribosyltransferase [Salibacteraceae bacterium]|tara:strand:- start:38838 stop:39365 length:528 start_codon:yes stop_codon:yes gene_type:complete
MISEELDKAIRTIPDFPKAGINFKDITPVLMDANLCKKITQDIYDQFTDIKIDVVIGVESRGFLFGMLIAQLFNIPFVTVRKKGKLPHKTISYKYDLEYGSAEIEMHIDAIKPGSNVLVHDDLLATGGTAMAAAELVRQSGGNIAGFAFLVELEALKGSAILNDYSKKIYSITTY